MPPVEWKHIGWIGVKATKNLFKKTESDGLLAHLQAVQGGNRHTRHARNRGVGILAPALTQPPGKMPVEGARRGGHVAIVRRKQFPDAGIVA